MLLATIAQKDIKVMSKKEQTKVKGGNSDNVIITDITVM